MINPASRELSIAHVVVTDAYAGTEKYVTSAARVQAERGHDVSVIGGNPARMVAALDSRGAEVSHFPASGVASAVVRLRRLGPIDVVHAHLTAAELAATAAFPLRTSAIVVATRHFGAQRGKTKAGRLAALAIEARLDGQVAPSRYIADRVDGAVELVPTGVPRAEAGPHDQAMVLVAQRLESEKDTATALRAWASSHLAELGWELHIAGAGSQASTLTLLARDLGVDGSVSFLGQVDDLPARMAKASAVLATAPAEPFGLSVVEAMACGTPVIAAAGGGHLETVGRARVPCLFPPTDHVAAANQLRRIAFDPSLRRCYGSELREIQHAHFSVDTFVDQLLRWYRVIAESCRASAESS